MDNRIMAMIPTHRWEAVRDAYEEGGCYWVHLRDGWTSDTGHIIRSASVSGIAELGKTIRRKSAE